MLLDQLINGAEFFLKIKKKEKMDSLSVRILVETEKEKCLIYAHHLIWPFYLSVIGFLAQEADNLDLTDRPEKLELIKNFLLFAHDNAKHMQHDLMQNKKKLIKYVQNLIARNDENILINQFKKKIQIDFGVDRKLIKKGVDFLAENSIDDVISVLIDNRKLGINICIKNKEISQLEERTNLLELSLTSLIAAEQVLDGDIKEKKELEEKINLEKAALEQEKMRLEHLEALLNKTVDQLNTIICKYYSSRGIHDIHTFINLLYADPIAQYNSEAWCQQKGFTDLGFNNHLDLFEFYNGLHIKLKTFSEQKEQCNKRTHTLNNTLNQSLLSWQQIYYEKHKALWQDIKLLSQQTKEKVVWKPGK